MAMRPILRLLWRRPLTRFGLIALLLAGAAVWYVTARGGWVNAFHLPPVLDASTPRSQNGFTLVNVEAAPKEDAAYLLVRPPAFPKTDGHYQESGSDYIYGSNFESRGPLLQVAAQTSTGDVTPLNWKLIGTRDGPQFYRIEIPGGYSNDCHEMNITLVPSAGPFVRWRITRLPNMRRIIPDAPTITSSLTRHEITATAQAWRGRHWINLQVRPTLPPDSHQWELATLERWSEWETFDQSHGQGARVMPIMGRGGAFTRADVSERGALTNEFYAPYRSASRYVREDCELRQFETYDEAVTFHNVAVQYDADEYRREHMKFYYLALPQPLAFTTPSGITVTLPTQGKQFRPVLYGGALNFFVTIRPQAHQNDATYSLPTSPLASTFGKPVKISLAFPPPAHSESWSYEQNGLPASYAMSLPKNPAWHPTPEGISDIPIHKDLPPVLKDFTVIIHQRVDIQAIPMTFTVPVSDAPPPDVH